jgi:hypothetical protein
MLFINKKDFKFPMQIKFYFADAKILNQKKVVLKSDKVFNYFSGRYACENWNKGTLFDANFLPLYSFRTDNWNDTKPARKL